MPVDIVPDLMGCDLSMIMPFAPVSLAFVLSGSIASPRLRTRYFPGLSYETIPTTSYGSLTWLASVKTNTSAFDCRGEYEAVPMRWTELLSHAAKNKLAETSSPPRLKAFPIVNRDDEDQTPRSQRLKTMIETRRTVRERQLAFSS